MNYDTFKLILAKSAKRILLVGLLLFFTGAPILISVFFGNNSTAVWVISLILIVLGALIIIRAVNDLKKIKSDSLPLLSAIKKKESDFIVWIYQKEITSQVGGANVGKSHNVVLWLNTNKHQEIVLGKKHSPAEIIQYLSMLFPKAYVGFIEENKKAAELKLKKRS